jgi:NAD(P)-dependent dehydrogenase (short-subunit alcohol dehydrogenase family)
MDPFRLDGRRILITGASSDIGRAIAVACSQSGAEVVITGRRHDRLEETRSLLAAPGQHVSVEADLRNAQDRDRLVGVAGIVDGVVHAAAIADPMLARAISADYIQTRIDTNYIAPMLLTKLLLGKNAIKDGGALLFISSVSAHAGTRGMSVYAATKASLVASARCLALELAPKRIRANCISPAIVRTSVYETLGEEWLDVQAKRYPLGLGRPDDVAYAAQFLLSDASRWVTGQAILLDGGCAWI